MKLLNHAMQKTIFPWLKKIINILGYLTSSVEISDNIFDKFEDVFVWASVFAKLLSKIFLSFAILYS